MIELADGANSPVDPGAALAEEFCKEALSACCRTLAGKGALCPAKLCCPELKALGNALVELLEAAKGLVPTGTLLPKIVVPDNNCPGWVKPDTKVPIGCPEARLAAAIARLLLMLLPGNGWLLWLLD